MMLFFKMQKSEKIAYENGDGEESSDIILFWIYWSWCAYLMTKWRCQGGNQTCKSIAQREFKSGTENWKVITERCNLKSGDWRR